MIVDLGKSRQLQLPEYDLCIVGSGPAGMTLANEMKDEGLQVCVLESGKLTVTKHADSLRMVQSSGIRIKDHSFERVLGGTSTTWGGISSLLDPLDLVPRSSIRHSGWPISREDLTPYYKQASKYGFPPLHLFESHLDVPRRTGDVQPRWEKLEEKVFLAPNNPINFGVQFRHIFDEPGIHLYLDATLIRLEGGGKRDRVTWGVVHTSSGSTHRFKARIFVLATGGIENPRILLNSQDICAQGLGNEHDQVGRYMMNHPKNCSGVIQLKRAIRKLPYYFGYVDGGYRGYAGLKVKEPIQEKTGVLSSYVRFEPMFSWSSNRGVATLVFLAKRNRRFRRTWKHSLLKKTAPPKDFSESADDSDLERWPQSLSDWVRVAGMILRNMGQVVKYLDYRWRGTTPQISAIGIRSFMEMEPHAENRVVLSGEKDAYGQPIPVVRLQTSQLDRQSLITLHNTLAEEVSRNGFGELSSTLREQEPWPIDRDASHHLGTTRMGNDPRLSVVNPDCRLHQLDNVYLAGGSVFPSGGCANPTFTIVALALRLAKHFKQEIFMKPCPPEA